jgi:hypothetical protein
LSFQCGSQTCLLFALQLPNFPNSPTPRAWVPNSLAKDIATTVTSKTHPLRELGSQTRLPFVPQLPNFPNSPTPRVWVPNSPAIRTATAITSKTHPLHEFGSQTCLPLLFLLTTIASSYCLTIMSKTHSRWGSSCDGESVCSHTHTHLASSLPITYHLPTYLPNTYCDYLRATYLRPHPWSCLGRPPPPPTPNFNIRPGFSRASGLLCLITHTHTYTPSFILIY